MLQSASHNMGVVLSIHQPNAELLANFDHLLVLGGGGSAFFGTMAQAHVYFTKLGFPVPAGEVLTEHALLMVDSAARRLTGYAPEAEDLDLVGRFAASDLAAATAASVAQAARPVRDSTSPRRSVVDAPSRELRRRAVRAFFSLAGYLQLLHRFFTIARRDLSIFYLQGVIQAMYGFLIGATFYKLPAVIDTDMNQLYSASLWIIGEGNKGS